MNASRFRMPDDHDVGAEMLRHGTTLEIRLYKVEHGCQVSFQLNGCLYDQPDDDDDSDCATSPAGMSLVRDMLDQFARKDGVA